MSAARDWLTVWRSLITARAAKGLSQDAIADRLGVTRQAVSHWERGTVIPPADKLFAWADLLGMRIAVSKIAAIENCERGAA